MTAKKPIRQQILTYLKVHGMWDVIVRATKMFLFSITGGPSVNSLFHLGIVEWKGMVYAAGGMSMGVICNSLNAWSQKGLGTLSLTPLKK
jgi:hypothetical protein